MNRGELVAVHHVAPWCGTSPTGAVLETIGRVGVVLEREEDGRVWVVFPDAGPFVYQGKELERVDRECPRGWGVAD